MSPRLRLQRRHALAAVLLALASCHSGAASFGFAEQRVQPSSAAYERLAAHFRAGDETDAVMLDTLARAWRRSPDLETRLATLALNQTHLRTPSPGIARARLDAWAGDLQGHRVLAALGHAGHEAISALLVARIAASGDGSAEHPRSVVSSGDALAFLHLRGAEPIGGYYGTPSAFRLTLIVEARHDGEAGTRTHHFDLSATLGAWQDATAWAHAGQRRPPRTLVEAWAALEDHLALTSAGFLHATEEGESGHYAAAKQLTRAAEAGNGVARYALADLYLRLAETRPEVAEAATAAAREHHAVAAGLGFGYARLKLGLLARRDGDEEQALHHLQAAHEAGEAAALLPLAAVLRLLDRDRADALLLEAAGRGRADAAYAFAVQRLDVDEETDPAALTVLEAAAETGHAPSRLFLGDLLATGRHLPEDRPRARALWTAVVDHGEALDDVLPAARALTLNTAPDLSDPAAAARGIERLLAVRARRVSCGECWLALADAHRALGNASEVRRVIARAETALRHPDARRLLADRGPVLTGSLVDATSR